MTEGTIILGKLEDKQLKDSINSLVAEVAGKADSMATAFESAVGRMKDAMKDFATSQKASVDTMREAWRGMATSFDSMARAQGEAVSRGNKGASKATTDDIKAQIKSTENELNALKNKAKEFIDIRNQIQAKAFIAKRHRATVQTYEYKKSRGETLTPYDDRDYAYAKSRIQELNNEIRALFSQRGNFPAPTKEDIAKITELENKLASLRKALDVKENTIGGLKETIKEEQKRQDTMRLGSDELKQQNKLIDEQKKKLKEQLATQEDLAKKGAKEAFKNAFSMPTNSIDSAEKKLERLQRLQANYTGKGILDESQWNRLQNEIEKTTKKIERLKKEAEKKTPQNLNAVMGMEENSLDAIARKMQAIVRLRSSMDYNKQRGEINMLNSEYRRLSKLQSEIIGKNQIAVKANNALARSFGYIRNRVMYALTLGAATSFVKQLYDIRGQYELLERSLGVLLDSMTRGSQIFQELSDMAIKSPFTLMELAGAAKQLTAYDFSAKEVVNTTRRLADISAALGVPMERLTYNLGQIRAQTVLTARDARDFANAGLPIAKSLADYYTELEGKVVSTGEVYDRMSKKMVSYSDVMAVLNKMTDEGGKFFDFQAKQAGTLKVQLANLSLAWNNMLNDIGQSHQGLLSAPVKILKTLAENWRTLDKVLWDVGITFGALKVAMMLSNSVMGSGIATIKQSILADKKKEASLLERAQLTRTLTPLEQDLLKTRERVTAADYQQVLSAKGITKQQALMMAAFKGRNKELMAALVNMGLLTQAEIKSMTTAKGFALAIKLGAISLKEMTISMGMALWSALPLMTLFAAIGGAVHIFQSYREEASRVEEVNKGIAESAKESSDALTKFLSSATNKATSLSAQRGQLSQEEGEKAWGSIREEIENSAAASDMLISRLLNIEDINVRVAKSFDYARSIRRAELALKDIGDETIKVSGTTIGHGLVDDLKDFSDDLERYKGKIDDLSKHLGMANSSISSNKAEFEHELSKTAESIKNFIDAEDITDPLEIGEILERVKTIIKVKNPEIHGELATLFDISLDKKMAELTNGAVDQNASLWKTFMNQLVKDSSSAFSNISDDIYSKTGKLTKEQQAAVDKNLEYFKRTMPLYYESVKNMVADASQLRIQIGIAFNISPSTDLQKEIKKRIGEAPKTLDFGSESMLPTANDDLKSWVEGQQKAIAGLREENKTYTKDNTKWSNERIKKNNEEIAQRENLLKLFNQSSISDKEAQKNANKARTNANKIRNQEESELQKTLKGELSLIDKIRSTYKDLTKEGMTHADAVNLATNGYKKTIEGINKVFAKWGIEAFDPAKFAGISNPRELVDLLQRQLDKLVASGRAKPAEIKDLQVKIQDLRLDAQKYDLKKITDGLNNELGKLKDEYELAVELDMNPELGNMFADILGIDLDDLPRTFGDAFERANKIARKKLSELNVFVDPDFDLLSTQINKDKNGNWMGLDFESNAVKSLTKWQDTFKDMFKKNITETEKMLDDYVKKYGDYSDKIAEIESDRLTKLHKLNEAYYTEEMRSRPDYIAKLNAIEQGAQREKGQATFDEFKNTRLYVDMFENLQFVSKATLETMRSKLKDLKREMGTLSPEQLKQVVQQFEKIDNELIRRNPFKGLIKNAKNYMKAVGRQGKQAQVDFKTAQRKYDWELGTLATMKEQLEQLKSRHPLNEERIKQLEDEITAQEQIVNKRREELEIAAELNEQYNLMRQLFGQQAQAIGKVLQVAASNLQSLAELRDTLKESFGVELGANIDATIDGLTKVGNGINQIVSSAQGGNVVGVVTGAVNTVAGLGDSIASIFGDGAARTKRLNREIERSQKTVRDLNNAYKELERQVDKSLGSAETKARRLAIANKEAELAELERQLALEQRKRSKDRDKDAIEDYKEKIQDLKYEIADLRETLVNELLGSDIKSAAEEFVDAWVEAWKAGETTLDAIEEKMDSMIFNLIKKAATSKIVANLLKPLYDAVDQYTTEGSEGGVALTPQEIKNLTDLSKKLDVDINNALGAYYGNLKSIGAIGDTGVQLSALQQGIQGITEDQAGALEAYWNANTQQQYVHTDLLTQIRDTIIGFDLDVQTANIGQILLQLQASYQVQMSIQSILEGVLNPSGRAFNVELLS